jgi:hypothetical protein
LDEEFAGKAKRACPRFSSPQKPADDLSISEGRSKPRGSLCPCIVPVPARMQTVTEIDEANDRATRGASNYSQIDDCCVAKAWVQASENSVIGTEQTGDQCFTAMTQAFNALKEAGRSIRTMESVSSRHKQLHREVIKFSACYWRVKRSNPTGVSEKCIERLATGIYNQKEMSHPDDACGKDFKFVLAWGVLRNYPKFCGGSEAILERSGHEDNESDSLEPDTNGDQETGLSNARHTAIDSDLNSKSINRPKGKRASGGESLRDSMLATKSNWQRKPCLCRETKCVLWNGTMKLFSSHVQLQPKTDRLQNTSHL